MRKNDAAGCLFLVHFESDHIRGLKFSPSRFPVGLNIAKDILVTESKTTCNCMSTIFPLSHLLNVGVITLNKQIWSP